MKKLCYNFYKAGKTSHQNSKATGNCKVNREKHRESMGRDMHRKVFQVTKRNEFQSRIFEMGFLSASVFWCKISQFAKFLLMKISKTMGGGIIKFYETSWEKY